MVWASLWQALPLFWHRDAVKADGSPNDDPGDYHGGIVIGSEISGKPGTISSLHNAKGFSHAEGKVFLEAPTR